jgi:outer membrane receptor for ferrienterochelin and colicin
MRRIALSCAIGLVHFSPAYAQQFSDDKESGGQLETVYVRSSRSIVDRFFAAGSMVIIDRRDIEELGAFSAADVLRQLPGVQVNQSENGTTEIRMRGMERNSTQILIDGQRVSRGRSQLPLDTLPAEALERIEVIRAPTAEFSGATAGTINIVLRQATVKRETIVRLTDNHAWNRDAGQLYFSRTGPLPGQPEITEEDVTALNEPWSYFVAIGAAGYVQGADFERNSLSSRGVESDNIAARYRRTDYTILPRMKGRLGTKDQIALRSTLSKTTLGGTLIDRVENLRYQGDFSEQTTREAYSFDRQYAQIAADWTHAFSSSRLETSFSTSRSRDSVARDVMPVDMWNASPTFTPYLFSDTNKDSLTSLTTKFTGTDSPYLWMMGGLLERRRYDSATSRTSGTQLNLQVDAQTERQALWGQKEWEVFEGGTFTMGLRGETLSIRTGAAGMETTRRFEFLQPTLHLRANLSETLQYRINIARITNRPGISDLVDRTLPSQGRNGLGNPDTAGNPELRAQKSWALDTGLEKRIGENGYLGINLFIRNSLDTIAPYTSFIGGRWVEQRVNIGDSTTWGLEVDGKGTFNLGTSRGWNISGSASLLQSRMTSGQNEGHRIPGQARYIASLTITKPMQRRSGGFFGGATLSLTGPAELRTSDKITGNTRARLTLDLHIGQSVRALGYWRVGIVNATDAPKESTRSYLDYGSNYFTNINSRSKLTPRLYLAVGTQF